MSASSATRLHRFLPHRYVEYGLQAHVTRCFFDGNERLTAAIDPERHLVSLVGQRFQRATVELSVALPPAVLALVLPPLEQRAPPVHVIAIVECHASRYRRGVVLSATEGGAPLLLAGAPCLGQLELGREELLGSAEITILLVRAATGEAAGPGWAVERGARLASARGWEVRVDANASPRGEYLDIREEEFARVGPPRFPQPDALYQLDCDGELVVLWLNSEKTRVAGVLHSEGTVGRRARLREVVFDRIYGAVWVRLFLRAVHDVVRLGEPSYPWQTAVLQKWLPGLYPEQQDHESRIEALRVEAAEGDVSELLGRLDLLIQVENQAAYVHEMLVQEVES